MTDIKDITTKTQLLDEACANAILTNSKKRRRQTFRLQALVNNNATLTDEDSDVVQTVYTVLSAMDHLTMIRYGAMAYAEWTGKPPDDLIQVGIAETHRYTFTSSNIRDPIQMYNDVDSKIETAAEILLTFIFSSSKLFTICDP